MPCSHLIVLPNWTPFHPFQMPISRVFPCPFTASHVATSPCWSLTLSAQTFRPPSDPTVSWIVRHFHWASAELVLSPLHQCWAAAIWAAPSCCKVSLSWGSWWWFVMRVYWRPWWSCEAWHNWSCQLWFQEVQGWDFLCWSWQLQSWNSCCHWKPYYS